MPAIGDLPQRIAKKIEADHSSGCWIWTAATARSGYGSVRFPGNGPMCPAHRVVYELLVDEIPDGLTLDHLCRNPSCVNPDHLEPVSHRENVLRGESPPAQLAKRTHCKNGHPYDEKNTYIWPGANTRHCRICRAARERIRYAESR